jgi:YcxB-like protein
MPHETTLIYTESLLRQAVLAFWWRSIGIGFVVALGAVAVGLGMFVAQGEATWLAGVLAAVLVLGVVFAAALYLVHYRNSLRKLREMGNAQATFHAEESSFTISSRIGTATLQWTAVLELWQFRDVWLLLYSKAQFNMLPLGCMSSEMQTFVRPAGGKVAPCP